MGVTELEGEEPKMVTKSQAAEEEAGVKRGQRMFPRLPSLGPYLPDG